VENLIKRLRAKPAREPLFADAADEIELLRDALVAIRALDPATDSPEGYNEWGEADCFRSAQAIAVNALTRANYDK